MRIAIAGAGLMGRWHAYYARQCGAAVCAVADPNRSARQLARHFGPAAAFRSVEALLANGKPDVLHICTPAPTHEAIIGMALDAGVHLIVEKPLAAGAAATRRLFDTAAAHNLLMIPVHQFPFQDGVLRAAASIEAIGRPLHTDATFCSAGGAERKEEDLDDLVADILPHPLSLLEKLTGVPPERVQWTYLRAAAGEWRILGAAGQMSVSILVSLHGRPTEASMRITGSEGSIHLNLFHGYAAVSSGRVSRARKIVAPFDLASRTLVAAGWNLTRRLATREPAYPGLRRLIALFYQAVRESSDAPISPAQAIAIAAVRDDLRRAARSGDFANARRLPGKPPRGAYA